MTQRTNTARHDIEHVYPTRDADRMGPWATLDVPHQRNTDANTPAIYAEIVALRVARGTVRGLRDAA